MSVELFQQFITNPRQLDETVRKQFNIPDNRYYTVSLEPISGEVRINKTLTREVKTKKISKSDS